MTDFGRLLAALTNAGVEFIVIGGFAATAHGSAFVTVDLDVVYARARENVARLARALEPLGPYLRGAPAGLPFTFDAETISRGLNFTLSTAAGDRTCSAKRLAAARTKPSCRTPTCERSSGSSAGSSTCRHSST